jgi:hypothetical protein
VKQAARGRREAEAEAARARWSGTLPAAAFVVSFYIFP